jgi:hypothetical protein
VYIVNFTDWFKHHDIHIYPMVSPANGALMIHLDHPYRLTSVEVVDAEDAKTNKFPHALWHMVADKPTDPTDIFRYGAPIPGMKPSIATAIPETLQKDTDYTMLVQAGANLKGSKTFTVK